MKTFPFQCICHCYGQPRESLQFQGLFSRKIWISCQCDSYGELLPASLIPCRFMEYNLGANFANWIANGNGHSINQYLCVRWTACLACPPGRWESIPTHYGDVIMGSTASQAFIRAQIKENIKALRHGALCEEFTGDHEFPAQRASKAENVSIWWRHRELTHWSRVTYIPVKPPSHCRE